MSLRETLPNKYLAGVGHGGGETQGETPSCPTYFLSFLNAWAFNKARISNFLENPGELEMGKILLTEWVSPPCPFQIRTSR